MNYNLKSNQSYSAIVSGISLIIMSISAIFSFGYVHSTLISNDSLTTFNNINSSPSLFQLEIFGWFIVLITDLLVSWSFYMFFKPIHSDYSVLACILRLFYTGFLTIAVSFLVFANNSIKNNTNINLESNSIIASKVSTLILTFESIWSIGLIIFGLHLILIGLIALKATYIPKILSFLLIISGLSYIFIHLINGFFPQFRDVKNIFETILGIPMFIGEIGFAVWLLFKAKRLPK